MKITALVENRAAHGLQSVHGLSLYIECGAHKILFDVGPDQTLFDNARKLGVDLEAVDTVILSHGHYDHGGALEEFLRRNTRATVYAQRLAFAPHYCRVLFFNKDIGVAPVLAENPRVRLLDGDYKIDDALELFCVSRIDRLRSTANNMLRDANGRDRFAHEQNLILRQGDTTVLVMGCGHAGVVNILARAEAFHPQYCVGGYHLWNSATHRTVAPALLAQIAEELKRYPDLRFYTCHCTGEEAFRALSEALPHMHYLASGDCIDTDAENE